jgi:hypothetical protein
MLSTLKIATIGSLAICLAFAASAPASAEIKTGSGGGGGFHSGFGGGAFKGGAGHGAFHGGLGNPSFAGARSFQGGGANMAGGFHNDRDDHRWRGGYGGYGALAGLGFAGASGYPYADPGYADTSDNSYVYEPDSSNYVVAQQSSPGEDVAYCVAHFKSYDPASGTYLGYDGMRHPCPE